ncbi:DUF4279 domain-containing protein [Kitasatospora sp. NPDC050463]|uniref:DUF4279 domain-containing protein n=1 Tax=Kitasatospora sp. NPDC050463 TaxID=3155786 RepID=UPI0033E6CFAB
MPDELTTQPPMPDSKWSAGSLRITSRTLTADQITVAIGLVPDDHYEHGHLAIPCTDTFQHEYSTWILKSGLGNDRWLDEHAAALVRKLKGREEALALLAADCELEIFLGFGSENGQGGCAIPARLLKEIGLLGLDIVLDLYPPTPDDEPWP